MEISLDRADLDVWGEVTEITSSEAFAARLRDFGLTPGTRVCRRYCSPGGEVTAVELRGSVLALRTHDLVGIRVHLL